MAHVLKTKLNELISMVLTYDKILIFLNKEKQSVIDTIHHWLPPFCVSFSYEPYHDPITQSIPAPDASIMSIIHQFTRVQA